ncbi:MAG: plastocyanin/azurin family copper-binding protein [Acidimicrobiia bacterium]|nr:plastocyanin/azurin family copper-binding protein [Acidimicrobiia bacterium]
MTQLAERPQDTPPGRPNEAPAGPPPPHPHYTLGSIAVVGVAVAVLAALIGIGALFALASRDSVSDDRVVDIVDERVAAGVAVAAPAFDMDVTPTLTPKAELAPAPAAEVHVTNAPNVPPPIARTEQAIVDVRFELVENLTAIDPETGVEFETWGYRNLDDGSVVSGTPGPMIRARVGDLLRFTLTNPAGNTQPHNIDLHAVTGQGGGAADTLVAPGETAVIEARMLYPGIFMYHCAAGDVPSHIARGMYGGILVDPETPLPAADKEFYVVQSEFYTTSTEAGVVDLDRAALTEEHPTMVVFNGAKGAIAGDNALQIDVGDRARFFFVNAGLNLDSNFHPIGSHWDAVWPEGALLATPIRGSQTTLVPAGGGVVVDLVGYVPSNIILVDHALTRAFDKGAIGIVAVNGEANTEIFEATGAEPEPEEPEEPAAAPVDGESVSILPASFSPQPLDAADEFADNEDPADYSVNVLTVPVGTTVSWTNDDPGQIHTVTSVDGTFDSGFMDEGDAFSFTFTEAGEYEYFCTPHPWMRAKVIVEG